MKTKVITILTVSVSLITSRAQQDIINDIVDGSVNAGGLSPGYLYAGSSVHADVQFANFNSSSLSPIYLELSAYGLPLSGPVSAYGFDNAPGYLSAGDFNAGTYLGTFSLPDAYGQPGYFDVTSFVHSVTGTYFGFELRSSGDILCSTAFNYGLPPELLATQTPEPSSMSLVISFCFLFGLLHAGRKLKPECDG
jgi:hypothetical protein